MPSFHIVGAGQLDGVRGQVRNWFAFMTSFGKLGDWTVWLLGCTAGITLGKEN